VVYALSNVLVDALPEESSRRKLLKQVTRVDVPIRTSLYEPGDPPRFAHFLTSGIASVVTTMGDGSTSEVGYLGREGYLRACISGVNCVFQPGASCRLRTEFSVLERLFQLTTRCAKYFSLTRSIKASCSARSRVATGYTM
jgi:hypothetical protein